MPPLIRYILSNIATGFALGALASLALIVLRHGSLDPLAVWLQVFALGAPFGLGFLGTALVIDAER